MTPLNESVRAALAIANDSGLDAAPGAGALFAALERVDAGLGWERVVLHLGDLRALTDEQELAPVLVEGHVASGACGRAVDHARGFSQIPTGGSHGGSCGSGSCI